MSSGALKELRGRIRSVISIQQTTRAMRLISAVKLRRAQDRLQRLRLTATPPRLSSKPSLPN
jgi:F0F1-type ATP synthase gamma subunit